MSNIDEQGGGTYFCSKCGQLKKGHTCPVVATRSMTTESLPLMMAAVPTMSTRRQYTQQLQQLQQQQQQVAAVQQLQPAQLQQYQQTLLLQLASLQAQMQPIHQIQLQGQPLQPQQVQQLQQLQTQIIQIQQAQQILAQQQQVQALQQQQQLLQQQQQQQAQQAQAQAQAAALQQQQQNQQNVTSQPATNTTATTTSTTLTTSNTQTTLPHLQLSGTPGYNPMVFMGISAEDKRAREKNASDFNMWFLLERQERYPYYFDPHTKTIQVIGSWYIDVSDAWDGYTLAEKRQMLNNTQKLANQRHSVLQKQHDIQSQKEEEQKREQNRIKDEKKMEIAKQMRQKQIEEIKERIGKPKTNVAPFFHYLNDNRESEKKAQPELSLADISKVLGQRWRNLDEDEKKPFYNKAADDRARFDIEIAEYKKQIQDEIDALPPIDLNTIELPEEPAPPQPQPPPQAPPPSITQPPPQSGEKRCESCGSVENRDQTISCISCHRIYHGKCLQLNQLAIDTIRKNGNWKCIDCKLCEVCNEGIHEDKMMFCDVCDKGYHTYCCTPKLDSPPTGGWKCHQCVHCIHCGSKTPGPSSNSKWNANYTVCDICQQKVLDRKYCTVCRKIMKNSGEKKPTIQCVYCDRWTHAACDGINEELLEKMKENPNYHQYKCPTCKTGSFASSISKTVQGRNIMKPIQEASSESDDEEDDEEGQQPPPTSASKRRVQEDKSSSLSSSSKRAIKRKKRSEDDDEEEEVSDVNVDE